MTTRFVDPVTAKSVTIYRNGDGFYAGRKFVVNQKQIRNFDAFLTQVTSGIRANAAVRSIYTPINGHRVIDLENIESGNSYVAGGMERFKKLGYSDITSKRPQNRPRMLQEIKPVQHSIYKDKVSARWREWIVHPTSIHIYRNGDDNYPAVKLLLPKKALQSWDMVLDYVTDRVNLRTGVVRRLYSIEGRLIVDLKDITNGEFYVAVGMDRKFKKVPYGRDISPVNSPRSVSRTLPPLNRPRPPPAQSRALYTQPVGQKTTGRSKEPEDPSKPKPPTYSNNHHRKVKRARKKSEEKTEAESVFHSRPTIVKRSRGKDEGAELLKYDDDPNGVYKAKEKREETQDATEVREDKDTAVDLPIDQVAAEEVDEEDIQPAAEEPELPADDVKASESDNKSETEEQTRDRAESHQRTPTRSRRSSQNQSPPPKSPTVSEKSNTASSRPKSTPTSSKQNTPKSSHDSSPQRSPPQSANRTPSPAKSENVTTEALLPEENQEEVAATQEDISAVEDSEAPPTEASKDDVSVAETETNADDDKPADKPKDDDDDNKSNIDDI